MTLAEALDELEILGITMRFYPDRVETLEPVSDRLREALSRYKASIADRVLAKKRSIYATYDRAARRHASQQFAKRVIAADRSIRNRPR
jgi:hypothetical protein